ncbi:hypothetical protein I601_1973 [Nocardioides dokdonensis FR1436]|uniref:Uncharacterized protein n=1 Tax=Nocardioides dokdonensis FR1436 TaxID=1300347 RepID=A0A1A9GL70_9ACTN|nr:hypothetical protein [Nocardioides dokdonensis]ANH38402.1 hypothetical protein I601_1973 [Nocardioides dokdonensis FR1436]
MRLSRPLAGLAAAALLGIGALSGCGVSEIQAAPGVAADVDGTEIRVDEVDELSSTTCAVLRSNPELLGQGYTGATVRDTVLAQLVSREIADSIAADNDIDGAVLYGRSAQQARLGLGQSDSAELEEVLPVFASSSYLRSVLAAVADPTLPADTDEATAAAAYQQVLADWQAEHDLTTNPLFTPVDFTATSKQSSDLSVAVSDEAVELQSLDPAAVRIEDRLPASQRCS